MRHPAAGLAALAAILMCTLGGVQAAVILQGGDTVPCSQLPELQHLALRVAILGNCK